MLCVNQGDTVKIAMTNIEQTTDELHGFGLLDYNINIVVDPGETKVVTFKADKPGVFPYYCTNFCSALHQEMQGYVRVSAAGSNVPLKANISARAASQVTRAQALPKPDHEANPSSGYRSLGWHKGAR